MVEEYDGEVEYLHPSEEKEEKMGSLFRQRETIRRQIDYAREHMVFESENERHYHIGMLQEKLDQVEAVISTEIQKFYLNCGCPF